MKLEYFKTRTFGKWILAGEHTVLRGGQALVFPLKTRFLDFEFTPQAYPGLEVHIPEGYPSEFKLLFWSVFEKACQLRSVSRLDFHGTIQMKAQIAVGSGLGASASLCVALTRWFGALGLIRSEETFDFAKTLEDVFHGESSGVDVAVVLSETGLRFQRQGPREKFESSWQPEWYLSHCGESGITKECVLKVQSMEKENPQKLSVLDEQMKKSVNLCAQALRERNQHLLIEAIQMSRSCFQDWGLVSPALGDHLALLEKAGALAVKPTGSGLGGYVLSLWNEKPSVPGIDFLKATV